jgi:hypothetical protein
MMQYYDTVSGLPMPFSQRLKAEEFIDTVVQA